MTAHSTGRKQGSVDVEGWVILCWGAALSRVIGSMRPPCLLDASSTPTRSCDNQKHLQALLDVPS